MTRLLLVNGDNGGVFRTKTNSNFAEIYDLLLAGLQYLGILSSGSTVTASPVSGDFYIVREAGTFGTVSCQAYDWLIYNGTSWQRLPGGTKGYVEVQDESDGTVGDGSLDPGDDEITHTLSYSYVADPEIVIQSMCDWALYLKSVERTTGVVTVTIGIGSSGSASTIKYKLLAMV